jgi:glucose/mannose-6-phosphate isomerase
MDIDTIIRGVPEQFAFTPVVENREKLFAPTRVVVGGMGGSHLPAGILHTALPELPLFIHHDYGLPTEGDVPREGTLFVAVSFSGNTEETVDFAEAALAAGLPLALVTSGGALLELAKKKNVPHVAVPKGPEGFQPRMAIGYLSVALLAVLGREKERAALAAAARAVPAEAEADGRALGAFVADGVPLLYSSARNAGLAYYLKALLNETPKLPAFINQFPEINHNEMLGVLKSERIQEFRFVFLRDESDHERVLKRMQVFSELTKEAGGVFHDTALAADSYQNIATFVMRANWAAAEASRIRGVDPFDIGLVEDFKKRMAKA